jgi:hypothetical protein
MIRFMDYFRSSTFFPTPTGTKKESSGVLKTQQVRCRSVSDCSSVLDKSDSFEPVDHVELVELTVATDDWSENKHRT